MFFTILLHYSKRFLVYPLEIFSVIVQKIATLILVIWFWRIVGKLNAYHHDFELVAYFLITNAVADLIMLPGQTPYGLGRFVRRSVRRGEFASYLLQPVSIIKYGLARSIGTNFVQFIASIVQFLVGIFLLSNFNIKRLGWFVLFLINAFGLSFAFNLFEAALALIIVDPTGIKNAIIHISRILSGKILPLQIASGVFRLVSWFSPFAVMIYWPSVALMGEFKELYKLIFIVGLCWHILLISLVFKMWNNAFRRYEAVGL